jgi:hypothetical protein
MPPAAVTLKGGILRTAQDFLPRSQIDRPIAGSKKSRQCSLQNGPRIVEGAGETFTMPDVVANSKADAFCGGKLRKKPARILRVSIEIGDANAETKTFNPEKYFRPETDKVPLRLSELLWQ